MQTSVAASPGIGANENSVRPSGASATLSREKTGAAKSDVPGGPIELRRVYRLCMFAEERAAAGD